MALSFPTLLVEVSCSGSLRVSSETGNRFVMRGRVGGLFLIRPQRWDSGYNHTSSSGCRETQLCSITGRRYSRRAPSDLVGRRDVPYGCTHKTLSGADDLCKVHLESCSCCTQHTQASE